MKRENHLSRTKAIDGFFGYYTSRRLSYLTTRLAISLGISANAVSLISLFFAFGASLILFLNLNTSFFLILGACLVQFAGVLDASDGEIARLTQTDSEFGAWLDSFTDRIKEFIYFSAAGFFVLRSPDYSNFLVMGLILASLYSNFLSGYITDTKKHLLKEKRKNQFYKGKFYLGMTDTRDFLFIVAFILEIFSFSGMFYLLWVYGVVFNFIILVQIVLSVKEIKAFAENKKDE